MKPLSQIIFVILITLSCIKVSAQTNDTITVAYNDTLKCGYDPTCFISSGCLYTLSAVLPPNFTVSDIQYSFTYSTGTCNSSSVAFTISLAGCNTPYESDGYASVYNSLNACLPIPVCINDTLSFILDFSRCEDPGAGCSTTCLNALSPFSISIIGKRDTCPTDVIEHQNPYSILSIYPNPANTEVALHNSFIYRNETAVVSVINLVGGVLLQKEIKWGGEEGINIKELTAGMYFVQVTDREGEYVGRFVKE